MEPEKIQPDVKVDSKPPVAPISVEETVRALTVSVALQEARLKALSTQLQTARMDFSQSLDESFGQSDSPDDEPPRIPFVDGGGLDLSICAFGYQVNPEGMGVTVVRIMEGVVAGITCPTEDINDLGDQDIVYVDVDVSGGTASIGHAATVPSEEGHEYHRLYKFAVGDVAYPVVIYRPFDIEGAAELLTVVTNVTYDPLTGKLEKYTRKIRAIPVEAEVGPTEVFEAVSGCTEL